MSAAANPDIVTDGLIFCLDAADKKSLLAPPTTNLANNSNGTINWTTVDLGATVRTQSTVDADSYHYRFVLDKSTDNTANLRFKFDETNLTDGETYIMSYKYKITSGSGTFKITDFCDVGVTRVTTDIGDGWYYETAYASRSSYDGTYDFFDTQASDNMTVDIKEIQVEHTSASSPLATPFVSYQRKWQDRQGSNDGTPVNMSNQANYSSDGRGGLIFDGASDHITTSLDLSWNDTSDASVFITVTPASLQTRAIIGKGNSQWEWQINQRSDGLQLVYWNTSGGHSNGPYPIVYGVFEANVPVSVGVVWNRNDNKHYLYKNGVLIESVTWTDASINQNRSNGVHLGGNIYQWGLGGNYWSGIIHNAALYNKALTTAEVLQNYNATKSRFGL